MKTPNIPWTKFDKRWRWRQGEHVSLIGPTGSGKTNLLTHIAPRRDYAIFLGTKRIDSTQTRLVERDGFRLVTDPTKIHPDVAHKWLLRPPFPRDASVDTIKRVQASAFRAALMMAFRQGRWAILADEIRYITSYLGLAAEMELLWLQGRSLGVTVVGGTQRPRHVPLEAFSQSEHLFFWRATDQQDVMRVAELTSINRMEVIDAVNGLRGYRVLYVNHSTGEMITTTPPPPPQRR